MQALLIFAIVILLVIICSVAGFWYYGERQARKHNVQPAVNVRRRPGNDPWSEALRDARNRH